MLAGAGDNRERGLRMNHHSEDEADDLNDSEGPDASDIDESDEDESETLACPICGKEVYQDVDVCPHCGNFIIPDAPRSRFRMWYLVIVVVVIGVLIWVLR
jgi:predicted nucleic acid-binding Zn ribbon protein